MKVSKLVWVAPTATMVVLYLGGAAVGQHYDTETVISPSSITGTTAGGVVVSTTNGPIASVGWFSVGPRDATTGFVNEAWATLAEATMTAPPSVVRPYPVADWPEAARQMLAQATDDPPRLDLLITTD